MMTLTTASRRPSLFRFAGILLVAMLLAPVLAGCMGKKEDDNRVVVGRTKGGLVVNANNMLKLLAADSVASGNYESAAKSYRVVLKNRPKDVEVLGGLGLSLFSLGKFQEAEPILVRYVAQTRLDKPQNVGLALSLSADNALLLHKREDAKRLFSEALAWFKKKNDRKNIASANFSLGKIAKISLDLEAATRHFTDAMKIYEARKDMPRAAKVMRHLGEVLLLQKNYPAAVDTLERAVEINNLHARWTQDALSRATLAKVLMAQGENERAAEQFRLAQASARKKNSDAVLALVLGTYASALSAQDRLDEAEKVLTESIKLHRKISNKVGLAANLLSLGNIQRKQGKQQAACTQWQNAVDLYREVGATVQMGRVRVLLKFGNCQPGA